MNGTNTLVGPGGGDAAVLRVKGTPRALALSIDGPGRLGALDPRLAGAAAVLEGALNVACSGAEPIGITDCLNFGSPETPEGYWQLAEAVGGMADACRALDLPIVSGQRQPLQRDAGRPDPADPGGRHGRPARGPITPGADALARGRRDLAARRCGAGSERAGGLRAGLAEAAGAAGRRGWRSTPPCRSVRLLVALAGDGILAGAHDLSVGGLGVALARMAIASDCGAAVSLPSGAAEWPTAALFGERTGRVLVAVAPDARAARGGRGGAGRRSGRAARDGAGSGAA